MMNRQFYSENRERLYKMMKPASLLVMFSGKEVRKTADEYYDFYAERNFVYLTGIDVKEAVLVACKEASGDVKERLYILRPDMMLERWTGRRLKPEEAENLSGIADIRWSDQFDTQFRQLAYSGHYGQIYLDLYKFSRDDRDRPAHTLRDEIAREYPFLHIEDANHPIRRLRLIKQPCEIEAMRQAERITCEGITAMMKASRPGMHEYQYKAVWDYVLQQYGPKCQAFPPIISAGRNNFCIHYYSYTGCAQDGDMILNDVGAQWDHIMTDVSRGFPCNGRFTEEQKRMYDCMLRTSDYLFSIIKPGMKMADVDKTTHSYNARLLLDAGLLDRTENVNNLMWHNGAHHVGFDVHDAVETPEIIAPNMVFCVDIGVYDERSGIGFRVEDNCLVTENGCENLSAATPRTVQEIEDVMRHP